MIIDASRSALEERKLARGALDALLQTLSRSDRFVVAASDITMRFHRDGFGVANKAEKARALAFVDAMEYDGASDLGLALTEAGRMLDRAAASKIGGPRSRQVVYIGDGTATWGETEINATHIRLGTRLGDGASLQNLFANYSFRLIEARYY